MSSGSTGQPAPTATTGPYEVVLDGELAAGTTSTLGFAVRRDGRPVEDLQPHLEARGHLVALRAGDLAYLHVHPVDAAPAATYVVAQGDPLGALSFELRMVHGADGWTTTLITWPKAVGNSSMRMYHVIWCFVTVRAFQWSPAHLMG